MHQPNLPVETLAAPAATVNRIKPVAGKPILAPSEVDTGYTEKAMLLGIDLGTSRSSIVSMNAICSNGERAWPPKAFGHPRPMVSDRPAPRGMPGGAGRHETRYAIATELPGDPVAPLMGTGLNDQANSYALSAASSSRLRFSLMKMPFTSVSSWNHASCSTPPGITPRSPGQQMRFSLPSPSCWAWAGLLRRQMAHDVVARARPVK